jgi:hypothetical protein
MINYRPALHLEKHKRILTRFSFRIKRDSVTTDGIGRFLVILPSFNYPNLKVTNPKGGEPLTLGPQPNGEAILAIWYHGADTSISSSEPTLCLLYTILPPEEHNYHPSQLTIPKPTANLKQWLTAWKATMNNDTEPTCRRASYELAFENSDQDLFLCTLEVFGAPPAHEMELVAQGLRKFPLDPATAGKIVQACVASQYDLKNKLQTVAKLFGPDSKGLSKFVQSILKDEGLRAEVRTTDFGEVLPGLGTSILMDLITAFPPPPTITVDKSIPVRIRAGAAFMGWGIVFIEDVDLGRRSGTINPIRTQLIINSFFHNGLRRMEIDNAIRVSICGRSLPIPPTVSLESGHMVAEYPKLSAYRGARFLVEAGNHRLVALDGFLAQVGLSPEDRGKSGWWLAEIYNSDVVSRSPEIQTLVRAREVSAAPPPTPPCSSQSAPVAHTFVTPPFVAPPHATLGGTQPRTQASDSRWVVNVGPSSARPRAQAPTLSQPQAQAPSSSQPQAQAPSSSQPQAQAPSATRVQAQVPITSSAPAIKRRDSGVCDESPGSNKKPKIAKVKPHDEAPKPVETLKPDEAPKPDETSKTGETSKTDEVSKTDEAPKTDEASKTDEAPVKKKPWKILNLDSDNSDEE